MSQLPFDFIVPKSDWVAPSLSDLPQDWSKFRRISVDTETRDDHLTKLGCGARRGAYITGYSIAFEDGPHAYLPVRHAGDGNLDARQVRRYMAENAARFDGTLVGMNLGYDLDMMAEEGIEFTNTKWFRDISIADPLINELQNSYSMDSIAARHGVPGKDQALLHDALLAYAPPKTPKSQLKRWMYLLPPKFVGPYAEQDALLPLQLMRIQERLIEEQELQKVFDLESRLLPALVRMRRRGVRIHTGRLEEIDRWALAEEAKAWAEIRRETGVKIDVGQAMNAAAIAPALEYIGVQPNKTAKGKPSIDKFLLESIKHPVGAHIRRARQMSQLRTTFVASVQHHMTNGRIHCTFNQLRKSKDDEGIEAGVEDTEGAAYGRLSCANTNLQQQPARDPEIGPMWRAIYLPEEGAGWASKDFSQQEPKWLIHCACQVPVGDPRGKYGRLGISERAKQAALDAAAHYRANPDADCYQVFADFANLSRKLTKEVYLGRVYGMGGPKMARKMNLPVIWGKDWKGRQVEMAGPEAQSKIDAFDGGVPYAKEMASLLATLAAKRGYILTHSGRRCRFPLDERGGYDWTHKALNREIQGSSADETKEAVVQLDAAGYFIQLQVHDEVDGSYASREEAEVAAEIMRNAVPKVLPTKVDVEFGPSWGEAK